MMGTIAMVVMGVGGILMLIGGIWLLVVAFQESVGWGIGCLIVPFVSLIFLISHWDDAKKPFFYQLGGIALWFVGLAMGGTLGDGLY